MASTPAFRTKPAALLKGSALQIAAADRARAGSREKTPTTVASGMPA
jgi:hypothetical protein